MKKYLLVIICSLLVLAGCSSQGEAAPGPAGIGTVEAPAGEAGETAARDEDELQKEPGLLVEIRRLFEAGGSIWLDSFKAATSGEPRIESEFCGSYNSYFTYIAGSALWNGDLSPVWTEYAPVGQTDFFSPDGGGMTTVAMKTSAADTGAGRTIQIRRESDGSLSDYEEELFYAHGDGGFLVYEGEYYYLHEMVDEYSGLLIGAYLVRFFEDGYYEEMEIRFEGTDYNQQVLAVMAGHEDAAGRLLTQTEDEFLEIREREWLLLTGAEDEVYAYQEWQQELDGEEYTIRLVRAGLDYFLQTGYYQEDTFVAASLTFIESEKKLMMRMGRLTGWSEQLQYLG